MSIVLWFQVGVEHGISGIPRFFYFNSNGDSHISFMILYIRRQEAKPLSNHYVVVRSVMTYLDPTALPFFAAIVCGARSVRVTWSLLRVLFLVVGLATLQLVDRCRQIDWVDRYIGGYIIWVDRLIGRYAERWLSRQVRQKVWYIGRQFGMQVG